MVRRALGSHEFEHIGEYRIVSLLGEGGQGAVYLGQCPGRADVAIKVLHARFAADPEVRRRFLREAEVAASVAAFCTARVLGTGFAGERPYIVTEYVPGPSLDELVRTGGPRTGGGLERLAIATLTSLASIHRVGIVHRDFKPGNVVLGPEGPVVIDFGIARAPHHMTSNTQLVGTPAFMSPEQLTDRPLTTASDMFSWAGTMVFAATGRIAFPGQTIPAILHAILSGRADISGVPDPLRPLVAACLSKDPEARPAAGLLLRQLTGDHPASTPPTRQPERPQAENRRGRHAAAQPSQAPRGATLVEEAAGQVAGLPTPEPDLRSTRPSRFVVPRSLRAMSRRSALALAAAVLLVGSGAVLVPSVFGGGAAARQPLDLEAFPQVDSADRFAADTSGKYVTFQPNPAEELPVTKTGGGAFAGTGPIPFFGLVAGPDMPSSGETVSVVTVGTFTEVGEAEDSLFVGWVKDGDNYVTAWYNHTRKDSGINVRVDGTFLSTPGETLLSLKKGDRFALRVSDATVTAYAEISGVWRRLGSATIGDVLSVARTREQYRYGFGVRGSTGTISIGGLEGRSA